MEPDPIFGPEFDEEVKKQILDRHRTHQMAISESLHEALAFVQRLSADDLKALRIILVACTQGPEVASYWAGFVNGAYNSAGYCPACEVSHDPLDSPTPPAGGAPDGLSQYLGIGTIDPDDLS